LREAAAMASHKLYTIGYEGASVEDLVSALKAAGVRRLIDVRYSPYSQRDDFSREALKPALEAHGLAYSHIGELGNPPAGREAARLGHRAVYREIFTGHLNSPDGRKGLALALELALAEPVCLMCLERSSRQCHRGMVAEALAGIGGMEVEHLATSRKSSHPDQAAFDF
jgi:uncharacterized protein (DUF488 family)